MDIIESRIDKSSEEYRANHEHMSGLVATLKAELKRAREERSEKARKRNAELNKMPVQERLDRLLDKNTSWLEIAPLAAFDQYDKKVHAAGNRCGIGLVAGREVVITASDPMIKGGTVYPLGVKKSLRCQTIAMENHLPTINLIDSGGAFLPLQSEIFPDVDDGGRIFYNQAIMSKMNLPQITVVMGLCTAGAAYIPAMSDHVVHVQKTGAIFLGGPPLVLAATGEEVTAEELGGAQVHCAESGVSDYLAEDDAHALQIVRDIMANLPANPKSEIPRRPVSAPLYDADELYGIVPRRLSTPYDAREIIARMVDGSEFLEYKALYGPTLVCGWAYIHGYQVGILANKVAGGPVADLNAFARQYLDVFATGYNYAFGIAAVAMLVSLATYVLFKGWLPDRRQQVAAGEAKLEMPWAEEKKRLMALGLVFLVVIFFWMSFHQNGLTLTYFARDYTVKTVDAVNYFIFDIRGLLLLAGVIIGLVFLLSRKSSGARRMIGAAMAFGGAGLGWLLFRTYSPSNLVEPEIFQQFNPYFVVFLTPLVVGFFAWLRARGREPSTPRKIGIGMVLASIGFIIMVASSISLLSPAELAGAPSPDRVSPYWLINTYLILTIAELFLSPMGLSFVSKVAPPRFQGLMQGGWLGATALGNQLLFVGSSMWVVFPLWQVWSVFVVCCLISAAFIFSILKRLEAATSG